MIRTRVQDGLRGPVKSYTEETTLAPVEGVRAEIRCESTTEYDVQGRVTKTLHLQSDGSQWVTRFEYGPSEQLLKILSGTVGKTETATFYFYDEQGRIQRIVPEKQEGQISDQPIFFRYDEKGRKTSTVTSSPADYHPNMATGGGPFEGLGLPPNLPGGGTSTTIYDQYDRPTKIEVRDAKGNLIMHGTRTYDPQGRVADEKQFHDNLPAMFNPEANEKILQDSGLSPEQFATLLEAELPKLMGGRTEAYTVSYAYDANGRLLHTSRRMFNHQDEVETTYNEHGDIDTEITHSTHIAAEDGTVPVSGPSPYSEVRYSYKYDGHGNWTERAIAYRSTPEGLFQPSTSLKRALTYY
ncbi:MAG TPA: hypothetical protein VJQ54_04020 [Candidatus Sulfotelmatobacter sp.]|nr:hypothetical protein [Candidatus Sulfotelmatobacter sp.]